MNEEGIEHYGRLIEELVKNGIRHSSLMVWMDGGLPEILRLHRHCITGTCPTASVTETPRPTRFQRAKLRAHRRACEKVERDVQHSASERAQDVEGSHIPS